MNFDEAINVVAQAERIIGFTGVGISTESGIPDFRSPNGVWANNRELNWSASILLAFSLTKNCTNQMLAHQKTLATLLLLVEFM